MEKIDLKNRVLEVLAQGHLMSLGVRDGSGVWVSDLIFIFDETPTIYWMSDPETRHSRAIAEHSQVAGTITISNKSKEKNLGIQFSGQASKIDGPRYDLAVKHLTKRGHPMPKESDDVLDGDSWYMAKLDVLHLIDEEHFGFKKQTINL